METYQFQTLYHAIINNTNLNKMGANGGTKVYADTNVRTGLNVTSIQPREATVITTLTGTSATGAAVNFITEFNISGIILNTTDLLIVPAGYSISAITLTSGSIVAYS